MLPDLRARDVRGARKGGRVVVVAIASRRPTRSRARARGRRDDDRGLAGRLAHACGEVPGGGRVRMRARAHAAAQGSPPRTAPHRPPAAGRLRSVCRPSAVGDRVSVTGFGKSRPAVRRRNARVVCVCARVCQRVRTRSAVHSALAGSLRAAAAHTLLRALLLPQRDLRVHVAAFWRARKRSCAENDVARIPSASRKPCVAPSVLFTRVRSVRARALALALALSAAPASTRGDVYTERRGCGECTCEPSSAEEPPSPPAGARGGGLGGGFGGGDQAALPAAPRHQCGLAPPTPCPLHLGVPIA